MDGMARSSRRGGSESSVRGHLLAFFFPILIVITGYNADVFDGAMIVLAITCGEKITPLKRALRLWLWKTVYHQGSSHHCSHLHKGSACPEKLRRLQRSSQPFSVRLPLLPLECTLKCTESFTKLILAALNMLSYLFPRSLCSVLQVSLLLLLLM